MICLRMPVPRAVRRAVTTVKGRATSTDDAVPRLTWLQNSLRFLHRSISASPGLTRWVERETCVCVCERERLFFDFAFAEPSPGPMRGTGDTPCVKRARLSKSCE